MKWKEWDLVATPKRIPNADYKTFKTLSPVDMFEMFFDDDIVDYLVSESTKYAQLKNEQNPQITKEEMRCFLAVLII
ncbi:hypothetical protein NQ314_011718 [Rhamnusium bicolor]|uniref:PiggyBac transposable element-derived protein domain-containing protein n=1 Tax=Rhamnusium bicolor TaxID=1586634 RepID=A0AAV8XGK2_9CUCU|nr:hypothetical protein NQ314_011718 [Rhamnusium bicolor]